jgi:hypothetical protein
LSYTLIELRLHNRDLVARLYPHPPRDAVEQRRRCARVSRQIAKLGLRD